MKCPFILLGLGCGFLACTPPAIAAESPREGPKHLTAAEAGVGRLIKLDDPTDIEGRSAKIRDLGTNRALVLAMTSTTCPVSKRFAPTLASLENEFAPRGVRFVFINPIETESLRNLRTEVQARGFDGPYVHDRNHALRNSLGARSTTEVFVLDAARTLAYRGAVDDQYGLGYSLEKPRQRFLAEALEAVLAGATPKVSGTTAPGCALKASDSPATSPPVTYHNRISRIIQSNCMECHRQGGVAPFSLESYEDVKAHAGMMIRQVKGGLMPPWFAAPPPEGHHSLWINDRSLSKEDKRDLLAWLDSDKAQGNPSEAPLPRQFPQEWQIGQPDTVLQIPEPIAVQATGKMSYKNVFVKTEFAEDRWVQAYEILPTAREVLHHVLVFVVPQEEANEEGFRRSAGRGKNGGYLAIYVPGNSSLRYPDGMAKKIPAQATLHFQIHYTPSGQATQDQTRLGLIFAKTLPTYAVRVAGIVNTAIRIPPGAADHHETATLPVPFAAQMLAFVPHLHLRGKAFRFEMIESDGTRRQLLDVPNYDFNWQLDYRLKEQISAPLNSRLEATGWWDNSADNPANPDPTRTIGWGAQTDDEMLIGYVEYYVPAAGLEEPQPFRDRQAEVLAALEGVFTRLDSNADGKLVAAEIPERWKARVLRLDANNDGEVTTAELKAFAEIAGRLGGDRRSQSPPQKPAEEGKPNGGQQSP